MKVQPATRPVAIRRPVAKAPTVQVQARAAAPIARPRPAEPQAARAIGAFVGSVPGVAAAGYALLHLAAGDPVSAAMAAAVGLVYGTAFANLGATVAGAIARPAQATAPRAGQAAAGLVGAAALGYVPWVLGQAAARFFPAVAMLGGAAYLLGALAVAAGFVGGARLAGWKG